ncbi:MAG: hypothetical protein AAGG02_18630 [Cyanobacteria bacterium P01_H01_bin.15]
MSVQCPCCSSDLVRCVSSQRHVYWYCRHCHGEMPDLQGLLSERRRLKRLLQPNIQRNRLLTAS